MSSKIRLLIVAIALISSYLFDRFWIANHLKWFSDIINLQFKLSMPGISSLTIPQFGLVPVLLITILIYILTIIPYRSLRYKREWKKTGEKIKGVLLGLLAVPVCMVIGSLIYLLFESIFPEAADKVAKAFTATLSFFFAGQKDPSLVLDGSIASLLGLLVGFYILSKKITQQ